MEPMCEDANLTEVTNVESTFEKKEANNCQLSKDHGMGQNQDYDEDDIDNVPSDSTNDKEAGRRRKHRRGKNKGGAKHHRKWRPYNTLTWEERQKLEERETERATRKREQSFANGQPMAPYNTTQFLMDQHEELPTFTGAEDAEAHAQKNLSGDGSGSVESSDEAESSGDEIFLKKDFTEAYESCHAEHLTAMSKEDLVQSYLELEGRMERMERLLKAIGGPPESAKTGDALTPASDVTRPASDVTRLRREVTRLRSENRQLQEDLRRVTRDNDRLRGADVTGHA